MLDVAGSLWSVPVDQQLEQAQRLHAAGLRRLHWDMSDGRFAAAGGFDAERAAQLTAATGLLSEAHLMAEAPLDEVDAWTEFCDLVVVHAETDDWRAAVDRVARRGCTPGLAISPSTPASAVPRDIAVLCMAITPGTAGSTFQDSVLDKVSALRASSPDRRVGVDGGVKRLHVERAAAAGASWVVVGNDMFGRDGDSRWADVLG